MNDMCQPPGLASPELGASDFKSSYKPIWCPGCGDYTVLAAVTKALAMVGKPPHEVAVVSGIGCSSRIPAYTSCYGFHGVHGRALAAGTGLKVARPDLTVLVASGDGDGYSIGGNHFLHACRRNVDLTYIVMDNHVYGMTKGQPSPTTEPDWDSKLSPGGTGVRSFHPLVIALASGANFVARCFSGDQNTTADIIAQGIRHPGFSFIEILSPCVTFRPEQRDWRNLVHPAAVQPTDDAARAAKRIMTDDGFNIGVLYAGNRAPYAGGPTQARAQPADFESEFAEAFALESEAAHRYIEFAEIMETHNNGEVAQLFRSIAAQEADHAEQIRRRIGAAQAPLGSSPRVQVPELERAHYLMQPWHVLQIAIEAEQRARDFFATVARETDNEELRVVATQLQAEEQAHVSLLEQWLGRVAVPASGWDEDPDPPRYTD